MKTHLKSIVLLLLLLICFSCKNEVKNKVFINKLATIQNGLPSPYFNYYLYFKMDNGKLLETNVDVLYQLYKDYYSKKNKDFNIYLENLITQKEIIKSNEINILKQKRYTPLNIDNIEKSIETMNTKEVETKFLIKEGEDFILKTNNVNASEVRTILYIMFTNDYIINPSDYGGYYILKEYKEDDFK